MNHVSAGLQLLKRTLISLTISLMILSGAQAKDIRVDIDGMFCSTCEPKVTEALNALPFLAEATASTPVSQACAELTGPVDEDAIRNAIAELTYSVTAISVMDECTLEKRRYPDNWAETDGLDVVIISRGEEVDLTAHTVDGKFTIFDFGAPWCGPCHVAEKLLKNYLTDHSDVALRAVVLDAQDANASFAMPVVAQHLQTAPGLPYFILVNPKGKTIARSVDPARILKKIDKKR